jgi:hypothetical protein
MAAESSTPLRFSAFVAPGAMALLLLVAAGLAASSSQRILLCLFFIPVVGQLLLINVGSKEVGLTSAVAFTHYTFFATVCWCVCFAVIVDTVTRQLRRFVPSWLTLIGLLPLALLVVHQRHVAEDGREMYDAAASTDIIVDGWIRQTFERLRQERQASKEVLRLPDFHIGLTNLTEEHFPLSAYLALAYRDGIPNVVVVPGGMLSRGEWQAASRALSEGNSMASRFLADAFSLQYEITRRVQWLMPLAIAQSKPLVVPNVMISSTLRVDLSSLVKVSYGSATELLQIVPCESISDEQLQELEDALRGPPHPARQWWLEQIEMVRRGRTGGAQNHNSLVK